MAVFALHATPLLSWDILLTESVPYPRLLLFPQSPPLFLVSHQLALQMANSLRPASGHAPSSSSHRRMSSSERDTVPVLLHPRPTACRPSSNVNIKRKKRRLEGCAIVSRVLAECCSNGTEHSRASNAVWRAFKTTGPWQPSSPRAAAKGLPGLPLDAPKPRGRRHCIYYVALHCFSCPPTCSSPFIPSLLPKTTLVSRFASLHSGEWREGLKMRGQGGNEDPHRARLMALFSVT